ncbi:uncharacterized protein MONBRDRAFT_38450, partial [Monosiga brevicollis MX1]
MAMRLCARRAVAQVRNLHLSSVRPAGTAARRTLEANDPYQTLSVEREASSQQIKERYYKEAMQLYPDCCDGRDSPTAIRRFDELSGALRAILHQRGELENGAVKEDDPDYMLSLVGKDLNEEERQQFAEVGRHYQAGGPHRSDMWELAHEMERSERSGTDPSKPTTESEADGNALANRGGRV